MASSVAVETGVEHHEAIGQLRVGAGTEARDQRPEHVAGRAPQPVDHCFFVRVARPLEAVDPQDFGALDGLDLLAAAALEPLCGQGEGLAEALGFQQPHRVEHGSGFVAHGADPTVTLEAVVPPTPLACRPVLLDRFRLDGRAAVVTGAGRGIGAGAARALAEAGADVALTARTPEQLETVAADIRALGRRALVVPGDVNDLDHVDRFVDAAIAEFGHVDIVVNNAGGSMPAPLLDTSVRSFEQAFHFNVTTAFALTKAALPHLLAREGGAVVNISSAMGRLRDRGFVAYGTA